MSSLCNYSHPELQITDGLVRQDTGQLFPYNPEFYDNATGLYGPGAVYCWYMLLASVLATWALCVSDKNGTTKPGLSSDLLGAIAYPAFAATDLVIQSTRMLGMDKRGLAIFCLRNPNTDLTMFGPFNSTKLDLNHIPLEVLDLGQRVIDVTGPLTICYSAAPFLLLLVIVSLIYTRNSRAWKPEAPSDWVIFTAYGYISLMLMIFHFSLGDIWISFFIFLYEAMLPIILVFVYVMAAGISLSLIGAVTMLVSSIVERNFDDGVEALKGLGSSIFTGGFIVAPTMIMVYGDRSSTVPDLGIRVSERDQLATLIVGVVTLTFTVIEVCQKLYRRSLEEERGDEEMQMLPEAETQS